MACLESRGASSVEVEDSRSVVGDDGSALLSVVVPVYNERETIEQVVCRLLAMDAVGQVVVVDDGSDPQTAKAVASLARHDRVETHRHPQNRGKGAALRTGFACCTCGIIAVQDADLEYDAESLAWLMTPILEGEADVVYGSRWLGNDSRKAPLERRLANRFLTYLSNRLTGLSLTDMETGSKLFARPVVEQMRLSEERFGIEPEMTAQVAKGGWRVVEIPISYAPRGYDEGKKIGLRDGLWAIWCIFRHMR